MEHKLIYNSLEIASDYGSRDYIEAPEESIREKLRESLPHCRMLDMGVGGGRTTKYFASLARHYKGADYAPNMVKTCQAKYPQYDFVECDVRDMSVFEDGSFDFVLFSYNGLDSFSHQDRIGALAEISRVLSPGGWFAFSSHNINWYKLTDLFRIRSVNIDPGISFGGKLVQYAKQAIKNLRLSFLNRSLSMEGFIRELRQSERGSLYDNSLNGQASVYYISRDEQVRQLESAGFSNISTYGRSGICTSNPGELNRGGWIYYLCQKK